MRTHRSIFFFIVPTYGYDLPPDGRYISQNYLCFHSNIFGWETLVIIRVTDIIGLSKEKTALVVGAFAMGSNHRYALTAPLLVTVLRIPSPPLSPTIIGRILQQSSQLIMA